MGYRLGSRSRGPEEDELQHAVGPREADFLFASLHCMAVSVLQKLCKERREPDAWAEELRIARVHLAYFIEECRRQMKN